MRARLGIAVGVTVLVGAGLAVVLARHRSPTPAASAPTTVAARPLRIGLWGDIPYTADDQARVGGTIESMNLADLDFSVFDGDFKGGGPCDDRVYQQAIDRFDRLDAPAVYVPGDNEWTDCRLGGADVSADRLAHLRQVMFARPDSFGRRTMALEHQSEAYPENTRWQMGSVVFVGVDVVGSDNNRDNAEEFAVRDAADRAWLHDSFDLATRTGAAGVMVVIQADPAFEVGDARFRSALRVTGLDSFVDTLRAETIAFGRPVALVHGDSHVYRLDHPLVDANGAPVPNLVRLETFGTPDVSWVLATIDAHDPQVFRFDIRRVG